MAQSGGALRSGRRGRWFESSRPDHLISYFPQQHPPRNVIHSIIPGQTVYRFSGILLPFEVACQGIWHVQRRKLRNPG